MEAITTTLGNAGPTLRRQTRKTPTMSRRRLRERVAGAFQRMAHGVNAPAAWASTVAFYRSGGQAWAKQLA